MIKKIIFGLIFLCLIIAIPLALAGIDRVELGGPFLAVLKNTSRELNNYKLAIPNIPSVPKLENVGALWTILNVLVSFINGFVAFLNFFVTIINYAIEILQFLFLLLKNLVTFRDSLSQATDNFPYIV